MKKYKAYGYLNSIVAAISYGTNPLFALPMYSYGYSVNSVLFYRYLFAVLIYGIWLKFFKQISLRLSLKEVCVLFCFGIIFSLSSVFLFGAFKYIDSGLACTLLFVYPLIIALFSRIFFREKLAKSIWIALFMVLIGITLLYSGNNGKTLNLKGVVLVMASAISYAIYMIGVRKTKVLHHIKPDKLSFYVMLFGLSVYIWNLKLCTELQPITGIIPFVCAIALAVFPTVISLETITYAIKLIGATETSIIGALEPLTALFFGVVVFGETITMKILFGIIMILSGIFIVILNKDK